MLKFIENLINFYTSTDDNQNHKKEKNPISSSLDYSIVYFQKQFDKSADLTIREMLIAGTRAITVTIEGMTNKETLANSVINPIMRGSYSNMTAPEKFEYLRYSLLSSAEQVEVKTYEDAFKFIMSGFAVIAVDGCDYMLAIGVQGFSFRGVSDPNSEVMQRGSREGFVEPLRINMTLIRRRIKSPKLKFELISVGDLSDTDVCLCYLTDMVSKKILDEIRQRIKNINLKSVLASGYISPYLEEKGDLSFFSSVGMSERPDTVCGKITEGRVVVLVDGTPNALIVPYLFIEYFQNLEDYDTRPYFATFTRWLKYISFFIATLLPGLYVAIGTFTPEVFPTQLLNKIASSVATTPFSLMTESLLVHFMYEIMREAGLRLPKALGHAVSIVGALVIGESAVSSGLIGGPTLMIIALTALSSYVIPRLYEPIAIIRLIFILVGGITGIWGLMLVFSALLVNICSKTSFGIPFTSPIAPFSSFAIRDTFVRAGWKILSKKNNKVQNMPGSNIESE